MLSAQLQRESIARFQYSRARIFLRRDRKDHNLCRRNPRRQDEPVIVAMHHHRCADQSGRHSPTRCPTKFLLSFAILKLDPACPRKILAEKMGCASLDRFSVLDHRFKRQRLHRTRKFLALRFFSDENREREMFANETLVNFQNESRFRAGLSFSFVNGVTFLPQKFGRPQK